MRGWVAISVAATPAAAPRRIREVLRIIIREPSGLRLRPTVGLKSTGTPSLRNSTYSTGWLAPPALATADCRLFLRWAHPLPELAQVNGYPLHASEQDMTSAADLKDQEDQIVSMTLIKLALLCLTRAAFFERLALLDTQGRHSAIYLLIAEPTRLSWRR